MIGIADPDRVETALAAGALACPGCTRPLHPWGHARTRTVRDHGDTRLALRRPRRARCRTCRVTHVLLPAAATLRRADRTAVIGSALLASARGTGYRRIAAELDRPLSTVRRWVRAVRDPGHVEWLRRQGMVWLSRVGLDVINTLAPQATRLGDALTALAAAALTLRARVVPHVSPWTLVGQITYGRLVGPPVSARPG
jgi:Homeodomain-like domain